MITIEHDADGNEIRVGTYAHIADELGVSVNQAWTWYQRRDRNGFPEAYDHRRAKNGKLAPHFDLDEVRVWRLFYVPKTGGWHTHRERAA